MDEVRPLSKEINETGNPARLTSVDSYDSSRGAVEEGELAYVPGHLSKASAGEAGVEINAKAILHHTVNPGQAGVNSKLLAAGFDPRLCCSTEETPTDLISAERNEQTEACSLLHCHGAPPPSPAANDEATPSEGKSNTTREKSRKPGRLIFGRKPRGGDSTSSGVGSPKTPMKDRRTPRKGRGRRPGSRSSSVTSETLSVTPGGKFMPWSIDPVQDGWVLCTDSNGFQYYWNEALQETRWTDASGNFPDLSPAHSAYSLGSIGDGLSSPAHFNFKNQSWENPDAALAFALGLVPESPVHSPGWPSPRGPRGGFMHLPPPTPKFSAVLPPRAHATVATTLPRDSSFTLLQPPPIPGNSRIPDLTASRDPEDLVRGISWSEAETTACARSVGSISGYKAEHKRCGGSDDVSARVEAVEDGGARVDIGSSGSSKNSVDASSDTCGSADISVDTSGSADTSVDMNADTSSEGTFDRTLESNLDRTLDSKLDSTFDSALDNNDSIDTSGLEGNFDRTVDSILDSALGSTLDSTLNSIIDTSGLESNFDRTVDSILDSALDSTLDSTLNSNVDTSGLESNFDRTADSILDSALDSTLDSTLNSNIGTSGLDSASIDQSSASPTSTESPRRPAAQGTRDLVGTDVGELFATRVVPPMPQRKFRSFSFPSSSSVATMAALAQPSDDDSAAPFEERQQRQHRSHAAKEISVPCAPPVGGPVEPWGYIWTGAARLAPYAPTALWRQEKPDDGITSDRASSVVPNALQRQLQRQQTAPENLTLLPSPTTDGNGAN